MASSSDSSSLDRHLGSLYPLARVLAGPEEADALVVRVYERAAAVPPSQRPPDERAWLLRLLVEVREAPDRDDAAEVPPDDADASAPDDPLRRSVAEQTAERMLPVAFAACSVHQRFVLTLDTLVDPADAVLAAALDTSPESARSARDQARSALRASLRDVLSGPERMLVDVALPDEALRSQLRALLSDQFRPPPSSLGHRVTEVLESARAERAASDDASAPSSDASDAGALWEPLRRGLLSRMALFVALGLLVVAGGVGGLSYVTSSAPSAQSVVELSVSRAADLSPGLRTQSSPEAARYIRQTWNRRVSVPALDGATLQGVGRLGVDDRGEVPALLYRDDETDARIVAYVFNYALVDRLGDRARLTQDLRGELAANDAPLPRQRAGQGVVLWRQRDDIFVLVAPDSDAEALRSRLQL
jgi:DNA-directed RNA polymerase specialized sigma24 family protein